ncbi:MAG TPA: RNA 2',3'-cyclic phosphodiesterase [Anaerolineae bacterium]|nr:RNA 2',3'-cyclic phosphodiesterase [Anaerolineae bacterium]HQK13349.1 RNA 2',3'-cyclic phosphodiesterase [Anaerolineae bacterium]
MAQPETLRTFVALPLSSAVIENLSAIQRTLRRTAPEQAVAWVNPDNIHLTLFFLGDIVLERRQPVEAALRVVARNVRPFTFTVRGLGAFPNANRPRVIWVGVEEPTGQLTLLHRAVTEALANIGFQPEDRRFSPHLTLGRVRQRASREEAQAVGEAIRQTEVGALGEVPAEELIFFRSVLKSSGAEYTPLARYGLGIKD